jgi:hypothetical protein
MGSITLPLFPIFNYTSVLVTEWRENQERERRGEKGEERGKQQTRGRGREDEE